MIRRTGAGVATLLLIPALLGCGSSYLDAVSAYAQVNRESVKALSAVPNAVERVCRKDAQAAFLEQHLSPGGGLASSSIAWSAWYATAPATGALTWRAYCEEIGAAGKGFAAAVEALSGYADALSSLASEGEYDGSDIESVLAGAGDFANLSAETPAGKAIKGISAPVGSLGSFLTKAFTERKVKEYSVQADPFVMPILAGLAAYVKASEELSIETELARGKALARVEVGAALYEQPVDPMKVVEFYAFAVALDADARETRATLAGFEAVIGSLTRAQEELTKAAPNDFGAKEINRRIGQVVANLAKLRVALSNDDEE